MFSHYVFQQINHKKLSIHKSQRADFQSKKKGCQSVNHKDMPASIINPKRSLLIIHQVMFYYKGPFIHQSITKSWISMNHEGLQSFKRNVTNLSQKLRIQIRLKDI